MKAKMFFKKFILIFSAVLVVVFNISVGAAEHTARLRYCMDNDHMYIAYTPDYLSYFFASNKSRFDDLFDETYAVVTGIVYTNSISSDKEEFTLYGKEKGIVINSSDSQVKGLVGQLSSGDEVTVYGVIEVKGMTGSSFELKAEHMERTLKKQLPMYSGVYYPEKVYDEEAVTDLAADGHVKFYMPSEWDTEYVKGRLTNNNVNGYQFYLNAISPQNLDFPENFYMFYFKYETYLDKVKKDPDSFDIEDIEELIIGNILGNLTDTGDIDVETISYPGGKKFDYCSTTYKPADGNDYRLEFFFKNDATGIVCMLYLYYPNDNAVNHIRDVAYVINTLETE